MDLGYFKHCNFKKCENLGKREYQFFVSQTEQIVLHIIKTGFDDIYLSVLEDAYEQYLGETFVGSKKVTEERFNIKL